ncbi:MAG: thioredoxin family protein [Desulfovibrio sp.]|nr:thioredoxin family protein [Desulfovibrio sp.]
MLIKVLGPGCAKCREVEKIVMTSLQETGCRGTVKKVSDFKEMMALGVMSTPAVVIDDKIMSTGRVPSKAEVMGWLSGQNSSVSEG